jgi:hypothetical protein
MSDIKGRDSWYFSILIMFHPHLALFPYDITQTTTQRMAHELVPLTAEDTKSGPYVGYIYLAAFYFCFTTMTTVGYGDIRPYSNTERIVCIFIEVS